MMREHIVVQEGEAAHIRPEAYETVAREGERIVRDLDLKIGGVTRLPGALRFDNMIGTIATGRAVVEVVPKTRPGENWMQSVLDLMGRRISIADGIPASETSRRPTFLDIIARIFTQRLSDAVSAEGPLTTIERSEARSPMLSGRLRIEEWLRRATFDGHRFPIDRQHLSDDNPFAPTLAHVGGFLGPHLTDPKLRRDLYGTLDRLIGGQDVPDPPAGAATLELPEQWSGYEPAWVIAQMILKQRSRFGRRPQAHGMSLVIEPWPLLERLLERTLHALAADLTRDGVAHQARPQSGVHFLKATGTGEDARRLHPDCVLLREGKSVVNFEAKYRNYERTGAPRREESYQAITAARALGTPLAVLVYPNAMETRVFEVLKPGDAPRHLAVMGLDLFGYRRGSGEMERAHALRKALENIAGTDMVAVKGVSA